MDEFHLCPVSDFYKRILLPLSYSLLFVLGLGLNVAVLWAVYAGRGRRRGRGAALVYTGNLAVADLLYVLTLPPLIVSSALGDAWPFGDVLCKAVRFFFLENLHCSMGLLSCLSLHRFLGLCFPVPTLWLRTRRMALLASGSVWVAVALEVSPTLVFAHTGFINNMTVCFEMTDPRQFNIYLPYGMFLSVVGFLLPFLLVVACSCSVIGTLYFPVKAGDAGNPNPPHVRTAKVRKKSLRTLLALCVIFVLCFAPYHVVRTVYLFVRVRMAADCRALGVVMVCLKVWKPLLGFNCCANPLLFFLGSGHYRAKLRNWRRRRNQRVLPTVSVVAHPGSTKTMGRITGGVGGG